MRMYCTVPTELFGDKLYPLSELKIHRPEIHAVAVKEYDGRKEVLKIHIPELRCIWSDVLFFTPIHPEELRRAWNKAGVEVPKPLPFFEIETKTLDIRKLVIYPNEAVAGDKIFFPFTDRRAKMYRRVRKRAIAHFKSERAAGRSPLWFSLIPQILYHGSMKVDMKSVVRA